MSAGFASLDDVIRDAAFPGVDLDLRRGRHIGRDDGAAYQLLVDGQEHLEAFYRRYGCDLVHPADGYFYLLPSGDQLGRRHLSTAEMLVGQVLALLALDPITVQRGGLVPREELLNRTQMLVGAEALLKLLHPKRRRFDERTAQASVRGRIDEATRSLAGLGFVELVDPERVRVRPALFRFADPVRGREDRATALEELIRRGEVAVVDEGEEEP